MQIPDCIEDKVVRVPEGGCWIWIGQTSARGYGKLRVGSVIVTAHRWLYEYLHGSVGNLSVDHLCRNTSCVNPHHLEAVTQRENVLRGTGPTAINAKATTCKNGHEFDRTVHYRNGKEKRICSICRNERDRECKRRRRAAKKGAA